MATLDLSPPPPPPLPPQPSHPSAPQISTPPKSLTPSLTISPLTPSHLPAYRRLLALLLPIPYQKSFFAEPLLSSSASQSQSIALIALWQHPTSTTTPTSTSTSTTTTTPASSSTSSSPSSLPLQSSNPHHNPNLLLIGAIQARVCSPSPTSSPPQQQTLYIQTLALLAPYRHLGIATYLFHELLARARERNPCLSAVWAHVWEASDEALAWYVRRGFVVQEGVVRGYYRRLRPDGARVVRMELEML